MAAETLFGIHGAALEVRGQRMGVLASNIANASTPGFKARDIDFKAALAAVEGGQQDQGIANSLSLSLSLSRPKSRRRAKRPLAVRAWANWRKLRVLMPVPSRDLKYMIIVPSPILVKSCCVRG